MTDPAGLGSYARLTFHGPLSAERADRLAAELAATGPQTVADYGCGWGELLLRVVEAAPGAHGIGIDIRGPDIARARDNATRRSLSGRVAFIEDSGGPPRQQSRCRRQLRRLPRVRHHTGGIPGAPPAGESRRTAAIGAEIWDRAPTGQQLAAMWPGISAKDCLFLPDLVDAAVTAGFRPLRVQTATRGEWEEFESGIAAGAEEWLLANADHPEAGHVRERLDGNRSIWLRGHRDVMGFAYLTLGISDSRIPG